jgi:hypothetical protein
MQRILQICTLSRDKKLIVFAVNTQGLLSPNATAAAAFNENVMIEINIDNTGDMWKTWLSKQLRMIRCISSDHMLPEQLEHLATKPVLLQEVLLLSKYGAAAVTSTQNGNAGPRDDPFFDRSISSNSWRNCYSI